MSEPPTETEQPDLSGALLRYRVMATIVGVLLVILVLVGLPLHYGYWIFDADFLAQGIKDVDGSGGTGWRLGSAISGYLGVAHGWLYLIFLITAFVLSRKARWSTDFTVVTLLSGTVPLLSFWAERRATLRVRAAIAGQADEPSEPDQPRR